MSDSAPNESGFYFMGLPTEIRLMVYAHLVVSPTHKRIRLVDEASRKRVTFHIETAILYASRQTYAEACPILYAKNKVDIVVSPCRPCYSRGELHSINVTYSSPLMLIIARALVIPKRHLLWWATQPTQWP